MFIHFISFYTFYIRILISSIELSHLTSVPSDFLIVARLNFRACRSKPCNSITSDLAAAVERKIAELSAQRRVHISKTYTCDPSMIQFKMLKIFADAQDMGQSLIIQQKTLNYKIQQLLKEKWLTLGKLD